LKGLFPKQCKPDKKEDYLTEEEFEAIFKMDKEKWHALKTWKQESLKK